MTTPSAAIRIRPDLVSPTCRLWPRIGLVNSRSPYQLYSPFYGVRARAWKLRVRPDIAARIIPGFPWSHEAWLRWKDYIEHRPHIEVFV